MVVLQGFVDDSSSDVGDRRTFLAAYINTKERWESFERQWDKELVADSLEYFKMSEAGALQGQFRDWDGERRDAKVLALAKIIEQHRPWFVFCSVSRNEYAEILAPVAPYGLKNPYFVCFWGIIKTTARYHLMRGPGSPPVDFIFDEQGGVGYDASAYYKWLKESEDSETQGILGATPIFCDDAKVNPLQAADMLAWHLRREQEGKLPDKHIFDLITADGCGVHYPEEELRNSARYMGKLPGIGSVQSKSEWKKVIASTRAQVDAGYGPPPTDTVWMRYVAFRAWAERVWKGWRRLRQRLVRKK